MAAVIGFQSPYNDQRSVVALLADSPRGNELLTNALNDSGKRAAMFGSVAVIRESGVNSLRVGDIYYVGHLPWFEVPGRLSRDSVLVTGHWSALGLRLLPILLALDSGCLWGGHLTALRLEDRQVFQVDCSAGEAQPLG